MSLLNRQLKIFRKLNFSFCYLDPTISLALFHNTSLEKKRPNATLKKVNLSNFRHRPQYNFIKMQSTKHDENRSQSSVIDIQSDNKDSKDLTLNQSKKSEIRRLLSLSRPELATLTGAIALLSFSSAVTMSVPFALGHIIDIIYTGTAIDMKQKLDIVCLSLGGVFVLGAMSNFGRVYLMNKAGQRITRDLRSSVFNAIIKQDISFFDQNKTGELINRLSADTSLVSNSVTTNISDGLRSVVMAVAGIGMMFYMSAELAVVGLCIVPPTAFAAIGFGRYLKGYTTKVQDTLASATQVAEERISNIRTVRSFAQEQQEMNTYQTSVEKVYQITLKESLARAVFFGMTGLSGNIIIISVLYYGGNLVTQSHLTIGQLSSFLLYAAYVGISFGGVSSFYSEMMRGLGASTRLFQLIDTNPTIPIQGGSSIALSDLKGTIEFKNVKFAYPTRMDTHLFSDFSLTVPAGCVVAVVGASGSGKSTLGSLLLRLYDPLEGQVCIDGIPLKDFDPVWLRTTVASVSQEPILFSTTIRENLLYGAKNPENVSMDQLMEVAREANALSFIESFPLKFETIVGERGIMLSGGQKQRIAIARSLLSNPKILLLDEATSALDSESESLVQDALERLMKDKTVITIAHRLSTIKNADKIAVLNNGKVDELGNYHELMQIENGIFKKLVEKQTIKS